MLRHIPELLSETRADLKNLKGSFGKEEALAEADRLLATLADRFAHPQKPLVVAVCGPTGAGKSHLVNYLAGGQVSPSSYRRPSTVAPVIVGRQNQLADLNREFLPGYARVNAPEGVVFPKNSTEEELPADSSILPSLYLAPNREGGWDWPEDLLVVDTPDFDSVRLENQHQAYDMARRADALILVAHQAKYADQSTWDFLDAWRAGSRKNPGPLLIIVNRVTDQAAVDDFQARLKAAGYDGELLAWPEEVAVGQVSINAARKELTTWLTKLSARGPEIVAESGRRLVARLNDLIEKEVLPSFNSRRDFVESALIGAREITRQWMESSSDRLASNLPQETRAKIQKGLEELVGRSDLWAKPRRWLSTPFEAAQGAFRRIFGRGDLAMASAERKLADSLDEAGREALVVAVRSEARALAEAAGLPSPQEELDFTPERIREIYRTMIEERDAWLRSEMEHLLKDLSWPKKAGFYFVQAAHLLVVGGLLIQTGGIPGTETLFSGALGPFISKIAGAIISKETLNDFELRAAERHHRQLAEVFEQQGNRYQDYLKKELEVMAPGLKLEEAVKAVEEEAGRVWS